MNPEQILQEKYTSTLRKGYVTVDGFTFPKRYEELKEELDNLEINEADVWICTFPKAGTTWTQEMVWLIINNLDYEKAQVDLDVRSPFLEMSVVHDYRDFMKEHPDFNPPMHRQDSLGFLKSQKSPLVIKSHLPFQFLPKQLQSGEKKPKIIYVSRDPRDTCVSYYHHSKITTGFKGDFDEFCELFLSGKGTYGPYWRHVIPFWQRKNLPNVLFLRFEDMKKDLKKIISTVAEFLNRSLSDEQIEVLAKHLSFESMQKNSAVNKAAFYTLSRQFKLIENDGNFIRSGTVGDHKNVLSPDQMKRFEKWIDENIKNTDYII